VWLVVVTALTLVLGWPFPVFSLAPILLAVLWRRGVVWCGAVGTAVLAAVAMPVIVLDSQMYGRVVVASYNTVMYNILGLSD
jgi:hypothetical protein